MSLLYVYVPQWLATSIFCLNQLLLPAEHMQDVVSAQQACRL
jgi:hypothetical protein